MTIGPTRPQNIVLRSHVTVALDSSEPYKHHDEVKAKYPRQKHEESRNIRITTSGGRYPDKKRNKTIGSLLAVP